LAQTWVKKLPSIHSDNKLKKCRSKTWRLVWNMFKLWIIIFVFGCEIIPVTISPLQCLGMK
jgi:hypothetical protein